MDDEPLVAVEGVGGVVPSAEDSFQAGFEADAREVPSTYMQRAAVANAAAMREQDAALARGESPYQAFLTGEEAYQGQMADLLEEWRQREYPDGSNRRVPDIASLWQSEPLPREEHGELIMPSQAETDHYGVQLATAVEAMVASPMPVCGDSYTLRLLQQLRRYQPEGCIELEERFLQRILTDVPSTSSRIYYGELCMRYGHTNMGREVLTHALETEYSAQMMGVENGGNGIRGEYLSLAQEMLEKLIEVEGSGGNNSRRGELMKILELRYEAMTQAIDRGYLAYTDSRLDPRVTRAHRRNIALEMMSRGISQGFNRYAAEVLDGFEGRGPMDTARTIDFLLELSREGKGDTAKWVLGRVVQQLRSRGRLRLSTIPRSLTEALGIEEDRRAE